MFDLVLASLWISILLGPSNQADPGFVLVLYVFEAFAVIGHNEAED